MKSEPLVSVIVPVYNVEKYLDECLESVVNQSYKNIEIILVDDGSTDKSGKMCDEWVKKDIRIKIVHKKNGGLNYARRDGFKKSTGEYVTFLDSDDFLHKDNIENLLQAIQETNADIAMCEMIEFTGSNRPKPIMSNTKEIIDSKEEAFRLLINNPHKDKFWSMTVWGKLYSKEIVESINWKESNYRVYEDNFWTPQAFDLAKRIVVLRKQLIYYRRYDDDSKPLSKQLTDNNLNGKPVGYLEFDWLWFDFYKSYIKRNNLKLYKDLYEKDYDRFIWRTKRLIEAGVLQAENNEEYIIKICKRHRKWFQNTTEKKDKIIHKQRELINAQNNEIMKIRSLKGATRNLAGAILRKSGIRRKVKK